VHPAFRADNDTRFRPGNFLPTLVLGENISSCGLGRPPPSWLLPSWSAVGAAAAGRHGAFSCHLSACSPYPVPSSQHQATFGRRLRVKHCIACVGAGSGKVPGSRSTSGGGCCSRLARGHSNTLLDSILDSRGVRGPASNDALHSPALTCYTLLLLFDCRLLGAEKMPHVWLVLLLLIACGGPATAGEQRLLVSRAREGRG
jgi:hypothetical protein